MKSRWDKWHILLLSIWTMAGLSFGALSCFPETDVGVRYRSPNQDQEQSGQSEQDQTVTGSGNTTVQRSDQDFQQIINQLDVIDSFLWTILGLAGLNIVQVVYAGYAARKYGYVEGKKRWLANGGGNNGCTK